MNLEFNACNRDAHNELKKRLDDNDIKYRVVDDDEFKVRFRISKDKVNDFQADLATNVMGNTIPGNFFVVD